EPCPHSMDSPWAFSWFRFPMSYGSPFRLAIPIAGRLMQGRSPSAVCLFRRYASAQGIPMMIRTLLTLATFAAIASLSLFARAQNTPPAPARGVAPAARGPVPADQPAPQNNATFMPGHELLLKKAKTGGIDIYFE